MAYTMDEYKGPNKVIYETFNKFKNEYAAGRMDALNARPF